MSTSISRSTATYLLAALLVLATVATSGCAGSKLATDLLAQVNRNPQPLVTNTVAIEVAINPAINNYEKIDATVKESLTVALANANVFGVDPGRPYQIQANVLVASQAAMSFGSFEGKLEISYLVLDGGGNKIVDEKLFTVAGSDKMYFSGAKRHRRARAVNISKNVLEFVAILEKRLGQEVNAAPSRAFNEPQQSRTQQPGGTGRRPRTASHYVT